MFLLLYNATEFNADVMTGFDGIIVCFYLFYFKTS